MVSSILLGVTVLVVCASIVRFSRPCLTAGGLMILAYTLKKGVLDGARGRVVFCSCRVVLVTDMLVCVSVLAVLTLV